MPTVTHCVMGGPRCLLGGSSVSGMAAHRSGGHFLVVVIVRRGRRCLGGGSGRVVMTTGGVRFHQRIADVLGDRLTSAMQAALLHPAAQIGQGGLGRANTTVAVWATGLPSTRSTPGRRPSTASTTAFSEPRSIGWTSRMAVARFGWSIVASIRRRCARDITELRSTVACLPDRPMIGSSPRPTACYDAVYESLLGCPIWTRSPTGTARVKAAVWTTP
jgi:hypothetical protein